MDGDGAGSGTRTDDRSLGELAKQLSEQTSELVRQEVELAKAELRIKGKRAGLGAGMFGGAGLFGFFAFAVLTAAAVAGLGEAVEVWLAAVIVGVVYGAVAGVLALQGKSKVQQAGPPVPEQTLDSVKRDVEMTKQRAQEAKR